MLQSSPNLVTDLLAKWKAGDEQALDALVPLVYNELRRVAHRYLRHERPDHSLQSAALVHEAYFRLLKQGGTPTARVLDENLPHQLRRNAEHKLMLDDTVTLLKSRSVDLVALDDALNGLAKLDPRQSRVVELRFFGGLSVEETSTVLGISSATVKRDWATQNLAAP